MITGHIYFYESILCTDYNLQRIFFSNIFILIILPLFRVVIYPFITFKLRSESFCRRNGLSCLFYSLSLSVFPQTATERPSRSSAPGWGVRITISYKPRNRCDATSRDDAGREKRRVGCVE